MVDGGSRLWKRERKFGAGRGQRKPNETRLMDLLMRGWILLACFLFPAYLCVCVCTFEPAEIYTRTR